MSLLFLTIVIFSFLLCNSLVLVSIFTSRNTKTKMLRREDTIDSFESSKSDDVKSKFKSMAIIPPILYGTAWKKDHTTDLVYLALTQGFRGIDTACQPKHYNEGGVGAALMKAYADGVVSRPEVFLQTKFTPVDGQDPNNIPYDQTASLEDQVRQSFSRSCQNLKTDYLDSLILHSPMRQYEDTIRVWRVFENLVDSGKVRALGISNTYSLQTFRRLYDDATVKPSFLQNRFYAKSGYDKDLRAFCSEKGVQYQSFWTLTANPHALQSDVVINLAQKYSQTPEQIFFRFVRSLGIVPLSGTSSAQHMSEDLLATNQFALEPDEVESISVVVFGE